MKIFYIEPYFGESHKRWIEGYRESSSHEVKIFSMPPRNWKWRMHGGALTLAEKVNKFVLEEKEKPDLFLVSAMIDLPLFKSRLSNQLDSISVAIYFHENQFAYPFNEDEDLKRDNHFGFINLKSALCADNVYFNSSYNMNSFLEGASSLLKKLPDAINNSWLQEIREKSKVLYLGMNLNEKNIIKKLGKEPLILWNHRWEFDKNPELFFKTLYRLASEGVKFRLAVVGQSFRKFPVIFEEAKELLKDYIDYWGFLPKENYIEVLKEAHFLPVSSNQDFFGISVVEAISHGVYPVLPDRLAYPEHFTEELGRDNYFYSSDEEFYRFLKEKLESFTLLDPLVSQSMKKYSWSLMGKVYDDEFFN